MLHRDRRSGSQNVSRLQDWPSVCLIPGLCGRLLPHPERSEVSEASRTSRRTPTGFPLYRSPQGILPTTCKRTSLKFQPHFIRGLKSKLLIQSPAFLARMQIYSSKSIILDPAENRCHHQPRHSPPPELDFRIHIQNHRPLRARIMWIRRPRRKQHSAAASHPPRAFNCQPMSIRSIRQRPRQPWPRHLHHPIQFGDRSLPHVPKHRPTVMQDSFQIGGASLANRNVATIHM